LLIHERFYSALNRTLRDLLDNHHVPEWLTANAITYFRTFMVIPMLLLLVGRYYIVGAMLVIAADFGDFLDGVVARYWVDAKKESAVDDTAASKEKRAVSPVTSDDGSFGALRYSDYGTVKL
jgi:hypothetical protein